MLACGVRRGHNVNHAGLISLIGWLADTQRWRSAHSRWRLQPLIERCTAYNYIWAHGKIAVWSEKCHIEIRCCSDGRVWSVESSSEFTVKIWMCFFLPVFLFSPFLYSEISFVFVSSACHHIQFSSLFPIGRLHVLVICSSSEQLLICGTVIKGQPARLG